MLLVDLAHFGQVNKFSGHAAGDAMLRAVVTRMSEVIGDDGVVGRLGGDEFAAIVPEADAEALAERILAGLQRGDAAAAEGIAASMGIARAPRDGTDADTLLRAADVALRVAKRSGRQQFSFYAGRSLNDEGPDGARRSLDRLIEGHGLMIVVQPIVDLQHAPRPRLRGAGPLRRAWRREPAAMVLARRRARPAPGARARLPASGAATCSTQRPAGQPAVGQPVRAAAAGPAHARRSSTPSTRSKG